MTKDYYEVHVTLADDGGPDHLRWTSSFIHNDPDLGAGQRHYRTTHTHTLAEAMAAIAFARHRWPLALRLKVEHVVFDERANGR